MCFCMKLFPVKPSTPSPESSGSAGSWSNGNGQWYHQRHPAQRHMWHDPHGWRRRMHDVGERRCEPPLFLPPCLFLLFKISSPFLSGRWVNPCGPAAFVIGWVGVRLRSSTPDARPGPALICMRLYIYQVPMVTLILVTTTAERHWHDRATCID